MTNESERLREALREICIHSNSDWEAVRADPTGKLAQVHGIAVDAYYAQPAEVFPTIYVRWSDDGQHIREWRREPFEHGVAHSVATPPTPSREASEDQVANALLVAIRQIEADVHISEISDHELRALASAAHSIIQSREDALKKALLGWLAWHTKVNVDDDCEYLNEDAWADADALVVRSRDAMAALNSGGVK